MSSRINPPLATCRTPTTTEVVIVGAGIIGLAHAVVALRSGFTVTVVDRDAYAVGASIRNFGHICATAQNSELRPLAKLSRDLWLSVSEEVGIDVLGTGCVTVAKTPADVVVLEQLATCRPDEVRVLDPSEVSAYLGGVDCSVSGGAYLANDLRVDPRTTVSRLASWVDSHEHGTVLWRHMVRDIVDSASGPIVRTVRGEIHAERVIVCVGHDVDWIFPDVADAGQVRRCRLNMVRLESPVGLRLDPAVLTPSSMVRYGGFTEMVGASQLEAELRARAPKLLDTVANVMCTQLADGSIVLGDTHSYDLAAPPFMDESATSLLIDELTSLLGVIRPKVIERWQGVYADSPQQDVLRAQPIHGVDVVTVTAGLGMTLSFGIAAETFRAMNS